MKKPISIADALHRAEQEREAAEDMRTLAEETVIPDDVRAKMDEDREKAQRPLYPCAKCQCDIEDADYVTIDGKHYCEDCAKAEDEDEEACDCDHEDSDEHRANCVFWLRVPGLQNWRPGTDPYPRLTADERRRELATKEGPLTPQEKAELKDLTEAAFKAARASQAAQRAAGQELVKEAEVKPYDPEKVRDIFKLIARKRANMAEMDRLLAEMEHTLVVHVGKERVFANQERYGKGAPYCERCRGVIGATTGEWAVEFDGRWWHKHNCGRKS